MIPATAIAQATELTSNGIGARAARHLDLVFRTLAGGPHAVKNRQFMRLITGELHPMGNIAIVANTSDLDITEAAVRPLVESNLPAAVIYIDGVDAGVADHVVRQGFHEDSMPAMVVEIERMVDTTLPAGYAFERVSAADSKGWTETLAIGYGIPVGLAQIFSPEALKADSTPNAATQCFAIVKDGRAVATSLLHLADGLAGIYCVATLADERGKGLGGHVTAEALRSAQRLGYRIGVLQSSSAGHSVYLRLGFEDRANVRMFIRLGQLAE
jgi:GNAT superfamily N-acetyltransferase